MNLIKIYGELKREQGIKVMLWEDLCWHGASKEEKEKFRNKENKLDNLIEKIENKLSKKHNIIFD